MKPVPSNGTDRRARVLEMLQADREMTAREIAEAIDMCPLQMRATLKRMHNAGLIENGSPVIRSGVAANTWRLPKHM